MRFENFNIAVENGTAPTYTCINVVSETGLPGKSQFPHDMLMSTLSEEVDWLRARALGCKVIGSA